MFLGFDFGTKKIGIATGQRQTQTATPLVTLKSIDGVPNWDKLAIIIHQWRPEGFVIGCPLHNDQSESKTSLKARAFGQELSVRFNLPVYYVDEHLTSHEARMLSREPEYQGKVDIDALAAMLILEAWLKGDASLV